MIIGPTTVSYSYPSCRDCEHTGLVTTCEGVHMRACGMENLIVPPIKVDGRDWYYVALADMTPNDRTPFWCKYLSDGKLT